MDAFITPKVQQGCSQWDAIAEATLVLTYNANEPLPKSKGDCDDRSGPHRIDPIAGRNT